jgi:hypothetical protein
MGILWPEDWRRRGRELGSSEAARSGFCQVCGLTRCSDGIEVTRGGCSSAMGAGDCENRLGLRNAGGG